MLNKIILMGRLTRDPELRHTQQGDAVASFTLAVDRDAKGQNGERAVDFIDCVAWKGTGELVAKYFTKGRMIAVSGRLYIEDWTDREGVKRRSAKIKVAEVYFCDSKKDTQATPAQAAPFGAGYGEPSGGFTEVEDDGNLPF